MALFTTHVRIIATFVNSQVGSQLIITFMFGDSMAQADELCIHHQYRLTGLLNAMHIAIWILI